MTTFSEKAVLVTGAGAGIGYALCQSLQKNGRIPVGINHTLFPSNEGKKHAHRSIQTT